METKLREVKIEEYWPLIVKNTAEFGQIAVAENPEFNNLAECIYRVLCDSFIDADMTEYGVSRWEKMLGITPAEGSSLDDRKAAILTQLSVKIPYTWRVLKQMLVPILGGEDKFVMEYVNDEGKLVLHTDRLDDDMLATVDELLARVLPANIELVQYNHHIEVSWRDINKYAECVTVADFVAVNPDFIEDLTSDGTWAYPMTSFPGENNNPLFRNPTQSQMTCFVGELPNLKIGVNMFAGLKRLTRFDCDLPIIQNAWGMFAGTGLLFFRSAKSNLQHCGSMFRNTPMTSFDADLSKLIDGSEMFVNSKIAEWHVELPNLQNASDMFNGTPLTEWHVELPNLQNALRMFSGSSIQVFNAAMQKLSNATQMFKNAKSFTTWRGAVPSLTNANAMFEGTAITYFDGELPQVTTAEWAFLFAPLVSFNSNLPKLDSGDGMFHSCQLNKESVLKICNSIPSYTSGTHKLSLGIHIDHQTDEEVLAAIANAEAKGWTLTVQWNGRATAATASTFGFGQLIYAKVGEMERPDGTTEKVLDWGHYVTDENGYETFRSLESAYKYFNLEMPENE